MTKPLRIGLDVAPMRYPYSGVRAYVEALIDSFRNRDAGIELVPLASSSGVPAVLDRLARLVWDVEGIRRSASHADVDLVHMTRFAAPRGSVERLVVTVHDLIPLQIPEYRASLSARVQVELACRTVPGASRVIVPSRYVAGVVQELLGIERDRIDVIPMGVSVPSAERQPVPLAGPYLLHTGGFDRRKNVPGLLRAFALAASELDGDWRLVLIGAAHSTNQRVYPPVQSIVAELGLESRVVMTGRVSELEKHAFYQHATIAISPSLNEGFGLPVLEAMAYGVPVIASDRTAHPEVVGDAGVLVEPTAEALADAIVRLAADQASREDLSSKGRARAAEFPWSRTALATIECYRNAIGG